MATAKITATTATATATAIATTTAAVTERKRKMLRRPCLVRAADSNQRPAAFAAPT